MIKWPHLLIAMATMASLTLAFSIHAQADEKRCALVFPLKGDPTLQSGGLVTAPEAQPFLETALSLSSRLKEASSIYVMTFFKTTSLDQSFPEGELKSTFLRFIEHPSTTELDSFHDAVLLLMEYVQKGAKAGLGRQGGLRFRHIDSATVEVYIPPVTEPVLLQAAEALTAFLNVLYQDLNIELLNFRIQADWELYKQTQWAISQLTGKDCWVCQFSRVTVYKNRLKYTELPTAVYERRERMPIFAVSESRSRAMKAWLLSSCSAEMTSGPNPFVNTMKGLAVAVVVIAIFFATIYKRVRSDV